MRMKIWQHALVILALIVGAFVGFFGMSLVTDNITAIRLVGRIVSVVSMLLTYYAMQDLAEREAMKKRFEN